MTPAILLSLQKVVCGFSLQRVLGAGTLCLMLLVCCGLILQVQVAFVAGVLLCVALIPINRMIAQRIQVGSSPGQSIDRDCHCGAFVMLDRDAALCGQFEGSSSSSGALQLLDICAILVAVSGGAVRRRVDESR